MVYSKIPENVRQFIFENIDSVEQLEVLLYLRSSCDDGCSAEKIAQELRSSVSSINSRMISLKQLGVVKEVSASIYMYNLVPEMEEVLTVLADEYKVRRHVILELIFSPLKKMKKFADSFVFGPAEKKKGDDNG